MPLPFMPAPWLARSACALLAALLAGPALASLDGNLASVQDDQQAWSAATSQSIQGSATVVLQTLPNGLNVRQYLDAGGHVFAVSWQGPVLPELARLLGPHFAAYGDAQRQQRRGVNLQSPALVLESGGMMRAFSGRAFLPPKLPAGWTAQDIR